MTTAKRKGWTLVDLLVTVAVVAAATAVVSMGLLQARESARRDQCAANLRRLGLGLQRYHQANGMLPPAAVRAPTSEAIRLKIRSSVGENYSIYRSPVNWTVLLLPHLGEEELAARFSPGVPLTDPASAKARTTELPFMTCPSDAFHRPDNLYCAEPAEGPECSFARGNYAINGGVSDVRPYPGFPWEPLPNGYLRTVSGSGDQAIERVWGSGVAGFNKCFSVGEFQNGLSNLAGIDEVRAGISPDDVRGVWALGEAGASVTWGHGLIGDDTGPNCRQPRRRHRRRQPIAPGFRRSLAHTPRNALLSLRGARAGDRPEHAPRRRSRADDGRFRAVRLGLGRHERLACDALPREPGRALGVGDCGA